MMLTKDQILQAQDLPTEVIDVPEWGGSVRVRTVTAQEKDAWEESLQTGKGRNIKLDLANVRAKLVALTVVDDDGNRLFTDKDVLALGRKGAKAMSRVYDAASKLNGISEEDLETIVKNSGQTPSDDSSTS